MNSKLATPQERGDWVRDHFSAHFKRLAHEAEAISESALPLEKKASRVIEIVDALGGHVAKVAACRRGCSYCCNQSVIISEWEAERIGKAIGLEPATAQSAETVDFQKIQGDYSGVPCVFLKAGECSIYENRPLACRKLYSLEDTPELCDMKKYPGGRVGYFNFSWLEMTYAVMFFDEGQNFADIREFFPIQNEDSNGRT